MQSPNDGVAPILQPHVHLVSGHRFPILANLTMEQAFKYLSDAPSIVKQLAPMSWQYWAAPHDGTIHLLWQAAGKNDNRFPSDGYVWADPESTYHQEINGYTMELMVHNTGYAPGREQMASHARTRFHFIHKSPSVNAPPPDPSLWVVHYHSADPQRMLPAQNVPVTAMIGNIMQERRFLEQQGQMEHRDFMLHDREHWPQITVPSAGRMPQPGSYGKPATAQQMQHRYSQSYYPQQPGAMGQPPAKRQRQQPSSSTSGAVDGTQAMDTSIEDEENTALGDFFDHLTPRDISLARYMQHHLWMEEVFSSPYSSGRIVPADLGLGLMGELKGLTDGILEPPDLDIVAKPGADKDMPRKPREAPEFTSLKQEQINEFNKRVEKHLEDGQAELQRMKEEHAKKMDEWRKRKNLMHAEKRLRDATWDVDGIDAVMLRLEESVADVHAVADVQKESVTDIVDEVEKLLGVKIAPHKEAVCVEKGGLENGKERPTAEIQRGTGNAPFASAGSMESTVAHLEPQPEEPVLISESQPAPEPTNQEQQPQPGQMVNPQVETAAGEIEPADTGDVDMSMMDDANMDMDMDTANIDFDQPHAREEIENFADQATENDQSPTQQAGGLEDWVMVLPEGSINQQQQQQSASETITADLTADLTATEPPSGEHVDEIGDAGDDSMFNDSAFNEFTNLDAAGDALIDFNGGMEGEDLGMDMEGSAFGDALHGTEMHGENAADAGGDGE